MVGGSSESKRIKKLREELVKELPKFPNDKETSDLLKNMALVDQLIYFLNWRIRFVSKRSRTVSIDSAALNDRRWTSLGPAIEFFLKKVEAGDDLTPHLSESAKRKGFTPNALKPTEKEDRWADKDLLLNVMGLHHFHLGTIYEAAGHVKRTDDVLFAAVFRDKFEVLGIFDHSVFDHEVEGPWLARILWRGKKLVARALRLMGFTAQDPMTKERERLWKLVEEKENQGALPGSALLGGMGRSGISLSGHPVVSVKAAQRYAKRIAEIDPMLDDRTFLATMYGSDPIPMKPKLRWALNNLDLGVLDESTQSFFIFEKGPY